MELIFNNQLSILIDILPFYLTPKQCTKLYTSNLILYNIYLTNNKFENNYYIPKTNGELLYAVCEWCKNKEEAIIKYGYINNWDISYITETIGLFQSQYNFNDDISDWNTSNIKYMGHMFWKSVSFNQDISNWNVSNVQHMGCMFAYCTDFNQNLNKWNIKNLKYINYIFYNSKYFDKLNCKDWNLSNIEYINKIYIFNDCNI